MSSKERYAALTLKMSKLKKKFKDQSGCSTENCCNIACLHDYYCLVSAFDRFNDKCYHLHIIPTGFTSIINSVTYPFDISVFPDRIPNGNVMINGYSFPDVRLSEFYSVYSSDECVDICAASARCTAASWSGEGTGICVLQDNESIKLSNRVAKADAALVFPTLSLSISLVIY